MRYTLYLALMGLFVASVACQPKPRPEETTEVPETMQEAPSAPEITLGEWVTTSTGLQYRVNERSGGEKPTTGDLIAVHYRGLLRADSTEFDASYTRGEPLLFRLGAHQVIDGWEEAFSILSVGDKATLVIPAHLGYGPRGSRGIPPNADLIFEVELVEITDIPPAEPYDIRGAELLETSSGLKYYLVKETSGRQATNGDTVQFHYTGYLEDGRKFDSTFDRGQPVIFKLGSGQLLPGWDEGMMLLKEGEKARLMIPPVLAFGPAGLPPTIPANATLIMDVELLSVY